MSVEIYAFCYQVSLRQLAKSSKTIGVYMKDVEVLDGLVGFIPLGRRARVTLPIK